MTGRHFQDGQYRRLTPREMGLVYTGFEKHNLHGEKVFATGGCESALAVLDGQVEYRHGEQSGTAVHRDILYLPLEEEITLRGNATVLQYTAPASRKTRFAHIPFARVDADDRHKKYGDADRGSFRHVWNCIDDRFDSARFLLGFCDGAPGGWTAWPPHAHGGAREEVYYYTGMGDGFGLQCVYDDLRQRDAVYIVRQGDLVSVPGGYHPNTGCPKTGIHYLFCMVSLREDDRVFMDLTIQSEFGDTLE